jgi:hypothetical protein
MSSSNTQTKTALIAANDKGPYDGPDADQAEEFARKIGALRRVYIPYPNAIGIMRKLDRLMRYGNSGAPVGSPARCFLLTGQAGSGKSALLRHWASKFVPDFSGLKDRRPVLYVEVPPNCKPKALAEQMLRALGMPEEVAKKGTEVSLTERVVHHLREQQVQVVVLDEFHNFINSDNDRVIYKAADTVKRLLNAGTSSFVLAGKPEAAIVYETNEQLMRRSAGRSMLKPFDWNDSKDQDFFRRALAEYERNLPFAEPSGLIRKAVALRLHHFARGLLGRTVDLLVEATALALERRSPCLGYDVLRETVENFRDDAKPDWFNPFDDTELKPLTKEQLEQEERGRVTRLHKRGSRDERAETLAA